MSKNRLTSRNSLSACCATVGIGSPSEYGRNLLGRSGHAALAWPLNAYVPFSRYQSCGPIPNWSSASRNALASWCSWGRWSVIRMPRSDTAAACLEDAQSVHPLPERHAYAGPWEPSGRPLKQREQLRYQATHHDPHPLAHLQVVPGPREGEELPDRRAGEDPWRADGFRDGGWREEVPCNHANDHSAPVRASASRAAPSCCP